MRYLITGGAGFVGSHLTDALVADGHEVLLLDNLSTGRRENVEHLLGGGRVELIEGSVTDAALVEECVLACDRCVHLASAVGVQLVVDHPLETMLDNVRGIDIVLSAAARHGRRVLFASTSEVYGKQSRGPLAEDADLVIGSPAKARWSYAIAKCYGEAIASSYHTDQGAETVVVRMFNAVGPRQSAHYGMVLPRFVGQALRGDDLTVFGKGTQTRCFTHVLDSVQAIRMLCDCDGAIGRTFNVGSSAPVAVIELAQRVIERTGSGSQIVRLSYEEAYSAGFEELGMRRPDTTALEEMTGWRATRTLDDAIDDVIVHEAAEAFASEATDLERAV
jgi:UDP-glucose 4-epimerase